MLGPAGRLRHEGQPGMVGQRVDGGRFSGVGASSEGHLALRIERKIFEARDSGQEFGFIEYGHGGWTVARRAWSQPEVL